MPDDYLELAPFDGAHSVTLPGNRGLLIDHAASGKGVSIRSLPYEPGQKEYEVSYEDYPLFAAQYPGVEMPEMKPRPAPRGNTVGRVVGETPAADVPAEEANPPVEAETEGEASVGTKVLDGLQLGLDIFGLIEGLGIIADLLNAAISALRGDFVGAGASALGALPLIGTAATSAKLAQRGADVADEVVGAGQAAAKQADEVAEAGAKQADEAGEAGAKQGDEAGQPAANKAEDKNNAQVKKKKKLLCGDRGSFRDLKRKSGDNQFDRDHVPAKATLIARAEKLAAERGVRLTKEMKRDIRNLADAVAVPKSSHQQISPSWGQSSAQAAADAADLKATVQRDLTAMLAELRQTDLRCHEKYKQFAKKLMSGLLKNKDIYDDFLLEVIKG